MKKVLLYLTILWANILFAQYTEWHVQTILNGGSPSNLGTENSPWDLQTALNNPSGKIKPGDVVWLHSGVYTDLYTSSAALSGTSTNYITVASYPGDWAILNGNIYTYVAPPPGFPNPDSDPNASPASVDQEMSTYTTNDDNGVDAVLKVLGGFVQFRDFEVTCIGNINRLTVMNGNTDCAPTNGFHEIVGISHSAATVNRYTNLVVKNLPGEGIGSWKFTADTEIYGCIIYNNGYILHNKAQFGCGNAAFSVVGKGPGIYSQNTHETLNRIIENNLILNNFDSGFFAWSSASTSSFDYLRNYNINNNVFINNGSPQRDETANIIIKSNSTDSFNHPYGINVDSNIFYLNSRSSFVSGIDLRNSSGVTMSNNSIFKGTAGVTFTSNNTNLDFQHNFYFGKRLQTLISPTDYATNNWTMDYNSYHTRSDSANMFEIVVGVGAIKYTLPQFQTLYNDEWNSIRTQNYDINTGIVRMGSSATPQKNFITQNKYNPNIFYVTIFNPRSDISSNDIINVDFTPYGIPNDKVYRIRDAEDYFGTQITGNIASNVVPFPMTLTSIEMPSGVLGTDFTTLVEHTLKDLHVFVLEFGCNIYYDEYRQNLTESSTTTVLAKNKITLGTNYIANNGSDVTAKASRDIKIIGSSHLMAGSKVLLKIEDPCPDITYTGEGLNKINHASSDGVKTIKEIVNDLVIYPNPNSGVFKLESKKDLKIKYVIIRDINNARTIFEQKYNSENNINIDISSVSAGLYTIQVTFDDDSIVSKTVAKK